MGFPKYNYEKNMWGHCTFAMGGHTTVLLNFRVILNWPKLNWVDLFNYLKSFLVHQSSWVCASPTYRQPILFYKLLSYTWRLLKNNYTQISKLNLFTINLQFFLWTSTIAYGMWESQNTLHLPPDLLVILEPSREMFLQLLFHSQRSNYDWQ